MQLIREIPRQANRSFARPRLNAKSIIPIRTKRDETNGRRVTSSVLPTASLPADSHFSPAGEKIPRVVTPHRVSVFA